MNRRTSALQMSNVGTLIGFLEHGTSVVHVVFAYFFFLFFELPV